MHVAFQLTAVVLVLTCISIGETSEQPEDEYKLVKRPMHMLRLGKRDAGEPAEDNMESLSDGRELSIKKRFMIMQGINDAPKESAAKGSDPKCKNTSLSGRHERSIKKRFMRIQGIHDAPKESAAQGGDPNC